MSVSQIIDTMRTVAGKEDAGGTFITSAKALSSGATKIKLDHNGQEISGGLLYRAKKVEHLESGKRVIVAVTSGRQAYYVIDELL